MPSALVVQPTTTPRIGSSHHWCAKLSINATGMPSRNPKTNPNPTIRLSSRWPKSRKIRTTSSGLLRKWSITMIFGSSSWSMWTPISSVTLPTTVGSWAWTRSITASRTGRGRSRHSRGCSLPHHLVDQLRDLGPEHPDDVLGDLVGLELLVELPRRTELGDRLVDGDAAHLGGPGRHDPLPADAALEQARHLLELARQHRGELAQAGHLEPVEPDRGEQHPQARPVDQEADDAGEDRDRRERDQWTSPAQSLNQSTRGSSTVTAPRRSDPPRLVACYSK